METTDEGARVPVWARETPRRRPALTREAIVDAAIALADAEGLAAVSIRKVAAELGARAMSLYSHIERKEDLFDLMYDQVVAESHIEEPQPGWREGVLAVARATRATMLRHPWMIDLASQRPRVGPNGLRHGEQSLAVLAGVPLDVAGKWRVMTAVDDYVLGHVIRDALEGRSGHGRMTREERDEVFLPYVMDMVRGGGYPNLAPLLERGVPVADDNFERGLKWLLDGLAADLSLP